MKLAPLQSQASQPQRGRRAARQSFYISVSNFSQWLFQILSPSSDPLPHPHADPSVGSPALDFNDRTQVIKQEIPQFSPLQLALPQFSAYSLVPVHLPIPRPTPWKQGTSSSGLPLPFVCALDTRFSCLRQLTSGAILSPFGQALPPR